MEQTVTENEAIDRIYQEIQQAGNISNDQKNRLTELFGNRFQSALKAIDVGKVKKYLFHPSERIVWIVVGKEGDYQILPRVGFCSCNDFYFRVISHEATLCYHLIAQKLAEALKKFILIENSDEAYGPLMDDWRKIQSETRRLPIGEVENVRKIVEIILSEEGELPISPLLEEVKKTGFNSLTTRHLSSIMIADKRKRFKCKQGLWILVKASV
ncbi:MAG: hypothetical protein QG670_1794 [Thermoproteota archaeon]|nr:hypothetical protein [Thermoproteota archaeon]